MLCANCGSNSWEVVDQFRYKEKDKSGKKINMSICTECGFVSYPEKWMTKEEIYLHYRNSYRKAPNVSNLFTGERKNHFHSYFLSDLFNSWKEGNKHEPVICDVGTAFGMSLASFKNAFPKAKLYGTELTTTMKRVAYHEFGFDLTDEIDESIKYDMIMSYKVLEHQLDPMDELKKYAKLLKEDGVLYISVPTWFNTLSNFGSDGFDLEYYYDPNHINVWTREIFENILLRSGFEIIKEDHKIYGDTYLCKVKKENENIPVLKINYKDIMNKMYLIKNAYTSFVEYKYENAIGIWPDYPLAWISMLETKRNLIADKGFDFFHEKYLQEMIKSCPNSPEAIISATEFSLRAQAFETAINYANKGLEVKPNNPVSIGQLITIFKELAIRSTDSNDKINKLKRAREFAFHLLNHSLQNRDEAISTIYFLNSLIPTEMETIKND